MLENTEGLHKLFIDGSWIETNNHFIVENKFSGKEITKVCAADHKILDQAVLAAKNALKKGCPAPHERAAILYKAAQLLPKYKEQLVASMVDEAGFTIIDASTEVKRAGITLELSAEVAKTICGEVIPFGAHPGSEERIGFTVRDPIGVVCAITPFNSPLNTVLHKIGPSFAAGNPTVLKPSSLTPLTAAILGKLLEEAGMPQGYLNIVQGEGKLAEHLLSNPDVAFYTFTGSTRVGSIIQEHVGLRRSQMELGSIASTIVCADANLENALPKIANAGFRKAGQVCTSVQRLYVAKERLQEVTEGLIEQAKLMAAGDPSTDGIKVGPLISESAAKRVENWIQEAVQAGANLLCGGIRTGRVIKPTVLSNVPVNKQVWCSEVFGPVITIQPFNNLEEAIEGANDTDFGLAAGVFTESLKNARLAMKKLRFGTVQINQTSSARADIMPFGGIKSSGFGKEGPSYAAKEMSIERLMVLNP